MAENTILATREKLLDDCNAATVIVLLANGSVKCTEQSEMSSPMDSSTSTDISDGGQVIGTVGNRVILVAASDSFMRIIPSIMFSYRSTTCI